MRDLCARLFRDYEFGLKLLRKDDEVLVITEEAIDDPDKFLSEWLVKDLPRRLASPRPAAARLS